MHVFSLSTQYLETSVPQHFPLILFHHSASHIPEEIQCTSPLLINTCLLIIFKPYSSWSWISSLQEVSMLLSHNGCLVAQLCPPLCIPLDCSPPGSSVNGILQARILEKVAISFCRGSRLHVPCLAPVGMSLRSHLYLLFLHLNIFILLVIVVVV